MKAVVTGGAGFIGSHLVDRLMDAGHEVHVIDSLQSGSAEVVHPQADLHQVDIRSDACRQIILNVRPDAIFHLAAQADVRRSIDDPGFDADVNIIGTIRLLEACAEASVKKFVFSSTSAVYGDIGKTVIDEDDPAAPKSFYGLSKWTAESYIRIIASLRGVPFTILRYGNVYGPRQKPKGEGGVIAVFVERIGSGLPISVHGDGTQTRDFVYVGDVVQANLAAVDRGGGETIHVGTGRGTSVLNAVEMLQRIHGADVDIRHAPARVGDIEHSCLDCRKARRVLGWQAQIDMWSGLAYTYRYFMSRT